MTAQPKEKWSCSLINDIYICCIWPLTHHPRLSHFLMARQYPSACLPAPSRPHPSAVPALPHSFPQHNSNLWTAYNPYFHSNDDGQVKLAPSPYPHARDSLNPASSVAKKAPLFLTSPGSLAFPHFIFIAWHLPTLSSSRRAEFHEGGRRERRGQYCVSVNWYIQLDVGRRSYFLIPLPPGQFCPRSALVEQVVVHLTCSLYCSYSGHQQTLIIYSLQFSNMQTVRNGYG